MRIQVKLNNKYNNSLEHSPFQVSFMQIKQRARFSCDMIPCELL